VRLKLNEDSEMYAPSTHHRLNHDAVCIDCGFDAAEHWLINHMTGMEEGDRDPTPKCVKHYNPKEAQQCTECGSWVTDSRWESRACPIVQMGWED
jgi:hypothetical protein